VLPFALGVGESKVDPFDLLVLDSGKNFSRVARHVLILDRSELDRAESGALHCTIAAPPGAVQSAGPAGEYFTLRVELRQ
jgi:hypothetical protein